MNRNVAVGSQLPPFLHAFAGGQVSRKELRAPPWFQSQKSKDFGIPDSIFQQKDGDNGKAPELSLEDMFRLLCPAASRKHIAGQSLASACLF